MQWTNSIICDSIFYDILERQTSWGRSLVTGQHYSFTSLTKLTFDAKYCNFNEYKLNVDNHIENFHLKKYTVVCMVRNLGFTARIKQNYTTKFPFVYQKIYVPKRKF